MGADTLSPPVTDFDLGIDLDSLLGEPPPEEVAHIVKRQGKLGAGALIVAAAEAGIEVEALCGHKFIPKYGHAPEDLPPCRTCVEVWQQMGGQL